MWNLGGLEIALILLVVLIVFGPKKLPALGRGVGEFFRNLKGGIKEVNSSETSHLENKTKS